jgi:Ca2+-binding EF-hand superfamily protein
MEDQINKLKEYYKIVFESNDGKIVMTDLEKRCHYNATTNIIGDSHESAYMEGQRSVLLFIKNMLLNDKLKGK